jgi:hypothetical protein
MQAWKPRERAILSAFPQRRHAALGTASDMFPFRQRSTVHSLPAALNDVSGGSSRPMLASSAPV